MQKAGREPLTSKQIPKHGEADIAGEIKANSKTDPSVKTANQKQDPSEERENSPTKSKSLILDMDETLLYASDKPLVAEYMKEATTVKLDIATEIYLFYLVKRPFLKEFLKQMDTHYNIYIYTASDQRYAKALLNAAGISPYITRLFHREHCRAISENVYAKNIFKLGFDPRSTIFIDDYGLQTKHAPGNSILVKKFRGDPKDHELEGLLGFLKELASAGDVRPVGPKLFEYHTLANQVRRRSSGVIEDDGIIIAEESKESGPTALEMKNFIGNVAQLKDDIKRFSAITIQAIDSSAMLKMRLASSTLHSHNSENDIVIPTTISKQPQRNESEGNLPSFIGKSPVLEMVKNRREVLNALDDEESAQIDELIVD